MKVYRFREWGWVEMSSMGFGRPFKALWHLWVTIRLEWTLGFTKALLSAVSLSPRQQAELCLAFANNLSKAGWIIFQENDSRYVALAIETMERAWALDRNAVTACRLGLMYGKANRVEDALRVYRQAFRAHPDHRELRYQTAITLLRHGRPEDVRNFFQSVLHRDPADAFANFAATILRNYGPWIEKVSADSVSDAPGMPGLWLAFSVWGEKYVSDFFGYGCAALMTPGNLPAIARRYAVRFVIFTTFDGERMLRDHPMFERVSAHAAFSFVHFEDDLIQRSQSMQQHYGARLGELYGLNCKFLMFSGAHYSTLEAARRCNAMVMPMGADNVFCDGSLANIARIMEGDVDAVVVTGFRLLRNSVGPIVEKKYRQPNGTIQISAEAYAQLLAAQIPDSNFVDSGEFTHFPLILCWRIGNDGVLVHSNHYHPCCIRAGALEAPLEFSIDPVDGRFLDRHLPGLDRVHIVQDTSIAVSDWGDDPLVVRPSKRTLSILEVSLWLWMYWDSLREPYFRTPLRLNGKANSVDWERTEKEAQSVVTEILADSKKREAENQARKSWILE